VAEVGAADFREREVFLMPGFDGTGPMGAGPMTGGARGFCNPAYAGYGPADDRGFGYGRGCGRGMGRGRGASEREVGQRARAERLTGEFTECEDVAHGSP